MIIVTEQTTVVVTETGIDIITIGTQGPQGATGSQGATGPQGVPGPQLQQLTLQQWNVPIILTSTLANIAWDCDIGQQVNYFAVENSTLNTPTNIRDGAIYQFTFTQNAIEYKTLAFSSAFLAFGTGAAMPLVPTALLAKCVFTFRGFSDNTMRLIGFSAA